MPPKTLAATITPRQLAVLNRIEAFQSSRCYSATIGELAAALNISRPTAFEHIAALRKKNLIAQSSGKARCLQLTEQGRRFIAAVRRRNPQACSEPFLTSANDRQEWMLAGRVSAGYGIEAVDDPQPFSVDGLFGRQEGVFVLKVSGSSMKDAGIFDGDYIVCRPANTAENGQIVVALLDGQNATLKRFYKDPRGVRLQPANDAFEPIMASDCSIRAVVVGVIRRLNPH